MKSFGSRQSRQLLAALVAGLIGSAASAASGDDLSMGRSKLLLTGGVSSIEGAAGGGLTPWALTGSYATEHEIGATAYATRTVLRDYALTGYGAAVAWNERVEISLGRQDFNASVVVPDTRLRLDIVGVKLRLAGDAIFDSDFWMPQIALGVQAKSLSPGHAVGAVLDSLGAKRHGVDAYLSATKLFLAEAVLVDPTSPGSQSNRNGLPGFESSQHRGSELKPEMPVAWLARDDLAVGVEVRSRSNKLCFAGETLRAGAGRDAFIA